jgi:hypothetical protein
MTVHEPPLFLNRNKHWVTYLYRGFEINLEEWGDGNVNAHMIDTMRNDYDLGMIANYVTPEVGIQDCVIVADTIRSDPHWYDEDD